MKTSAEPQDDGNLPASDGEAFEGFTLTTRVTGTEPIDESL
jgi:hypothetical protein